MMGEENVNAAEVQQNIENTVKNAAEWYENANLEDSKALLSAQFRSAARSFIAIGYFLKHIRDKELFREDGYESVWEFAQHEFGVSKSTASRYMSMNDRFSKNGNTPVIAEQYQDYDKSKLQEMLSLTDEQMQQVTPDMKVQEIRQMKKSKEVPYFEMEGQLDFEMNFPEVMPEKNDYAEPMQTKPDTVTLDVSDFMEIGIDEPEPEEEEAVATSQQEEAPEDKDTQMESESEKIQRFIRTWKEVCPSDFEKACQAIRFNENNTEQAKKIQKSLAPYGAHYIGNGEWEFDFHGFSGGMDWKIGTERLHLKYRRLAMELLEMYGSCPEADVIEAEVVEVEPELEPVKTFDQLILKELIDDTQEMLNQMQDYWKENQPRTYTKYVMMLHAYQMLLQANAEQEGEAET